MIQRIPIYLVSMKPDLSMNSDLPSTIYYKNCCCSEHRIL